jgi:hypothetical protein
MPKAFTPVVFAANDLIEGTSVYLAPEGWTPDVRAAAVARDADEKAALEARAQAGEAENRVVGAYAVEVAIEDGVPAPVKRRERIKASHETSIPVGPRARIDRAA